jgi:hypothetical protein
MGLWLPFSCLLGTSFFVVQKFTLKTERQSANNLSDLSIALQCCKEEQTISLYYVFHIFVARNVGFGWCICLGTQWMGRRVILAPFNLIFSTEVSF